LTYPSLSLDNSGIEIQALPEAVDARSESEHISTIGQIMNKLREIGRGTSSKMLKRSLSVPADSSRYKISKIMPRKGSLHVLSAESDADFNSSLTSSEMSSVALSEIAVEEHVPDMITQA
jgi:hypothetical protein